MARRRPSAIRWIGIYAGIKSMWFSVYQDGGIEFGCDGQALFGRYGVLVKIKQGNVIDVCIN